ncbi:MAG: redoxin domain-containing protein [Lentisphaerae bacterium]|jgi:thiol-disulfide isomerase/thioredoxin|nr:redoxin domain-containing protein [Lentisphaerota bacterium]MBT5607510.1 redoxin domain-containing protein [Lentisphaerota bacterium]MBT7058214.1 redoxin domain-containing protein [Lentisphaerota bacterium]MBT7840741.1 redoxin domain-containing protein [Lentisphaerota bacterium]
MKCHVLAASALMVACASAPAEDTFIRERIPARDTTSQDALEGKPPPALQIKEWVNGEGAVISDLKDKVVVLRIWATWCGPCRRSAPQVKKLYMTYKKRGLAIVGIHTTRGGDKAAAFAKEHTLPWPVGVDDADKTANALGAVAGKPDYYLIDRAGVLRFADIEEVELEKAVKLLLNEPIPTPQTRE